MKRSLPVLLVVIAAAGCAATSTPLPLDADHPAAVEAAASPMPEPSRTLDGGEPVQSAAPATSTPAHHHGASVSAASQPAPAVADLYVCPMHADVTSATPADCPKCGMKLVKSAASNGGHNAH